MGTEIESIDERPTLLELFMRLYTGNRRGANERRGFFLPLPQDSCHFLEVLIIWSLAGMPSPVFFADDKVFF